MNDDRGFVGVVIAAPQPMPRREVTDLIIWGIAVTIGLHVLVLGGAALGGYLDSIHTEKRAATLEEQRPISIEAGLAIKAKSTKGKKSKLPQKDVAPKVKQPDAPGFSTNPDAPVDPTKKKDKPDEYIPPDKQDPASVFDKFRNVDTGEQAATEGDGKDDENVVGAADGSEWGRLDKAVGDPYVGELVGRMTKDFTVPSVVTETGLETWACLKLDESGKVGKRWIDDEHRSKSHAFNSAVEDRLDKTTDMEQPVPDHLKQMLVENGACVPFKL